jgi:phosphatidylinositol glycan class B
MLHANPPSPFSITYRSWYLPTAFFYALAAWFSSGFYHYDEHFQILEFSAYLWGAIPRENLPWEFQAQMRPWLQSYLLSPLQPFGPHTSIFIARLIMGQIYLYLMFRWLLATREEVEPIGDSYVKFGLLLWFLPMLAVRYSSEMFSSLFLLLFCLLFLERNKTFKIWFALGVVGAISFWSRFQVGVFLFFPIIHLLLSTKEYHKTILMIAGFGCTCLLMIALDSRAYGSLVFTPWTYFDQNILQGKTSNYGENPPWDYLKWIIAKPTPLIGLPLLLGFAFLLKHSFKNPLLQGCAAFFLVHLAIGHKEFRFLFPLLPFVPLFVWYAFKKMKLNAKWIRNFSIFNLMLLPLSLQALHPLENLSKQFEPGSDVQIMNIERPDIMAGGLTTNYFFAKDVIFTKETRKLKFFDRVGPMEEALSEGCELLYSSHYLHSLQRKVGI